MAIDLVLYSIAFTALVIGAITDIRTREVPDWINFGLIFAGIGIRALYSIFTFEWMFLANGLIGLGVFVAIAYAMFYAGLWGGGDSKMLMGIGALVGLPLVFRPLPLLVVFFINIFLIGAVYGLFYSIGLAVKHRKRFVKEFLKIAHDKRTMRWRKIVLLSLVALVLLILFLVADLILKWILLVFVLVVYISFYLMFFIKAVELAAMFKYVDPSELTEGDWIARNYYVDREKICGPKDLGIDRKQIRKLIALKRKGKVKKIKIKEGLPFVPSFLIGFAISLIWGAWWMFLF